MAGRGEEEAVWTLLQTKLRVENPQSLFNYLRMEPAMFDELAHSGRIWSGQNGSNVIGIP